MIAFFLNILIVRKFDITHLAHETLMMMKKTECKNDFFLFLYQIVKGVLMNKNKSEIQTKFINKKRLQIN